MLDERLGFDGTCGSCHLRSLELYVRTRLCFCDEGLFLSHLPLFLHNLERLPVDRFQLRREWSHLWPEGCE